MSVTEILYKDISPGAEEDAEITTGSAAAFSDPSALPFGVENAPVLTLEENAWGLDGTFVPLETQHIAFWSSEMSGGDCAFLNPPRITALMDEQYSATGLTLIFDTATGEYCRKVRVAWYQGETVLADAEFYPDSAQYFCQQRVESYNKVEITLEETSLPWRYAKLTGIMFGIHRRFRMDEIRKAQVVNEMNGIAEELPVSKLNWTLDSRENIDFMFQLKQPVEVWNDGNLLGVYYIDTSSRSALTVYTIGCHDAFGVLDESAFPGGVYTAYSASQLLADIVDGDFELDVQAPDVRLTGAIASCTKREAVQQVLFAWMVCAATDGTEKIRVFATDETETVIGPERTYTGVSVQTDSIITRVEVTAHSFTQSEQGSVEINGVRYLDTEAVYAVDNPNVTATDKKKVVEVTGATLVSPAIAQAVARRVYDYHMRRNTNASDFVWAGERLGDLVSQPTPWGTTTTGHLLKMEIRLSNTVAVGSEARGV